MALSDLRRQSVLQDDPRDNHAGGLRQAVALGNDRTVIMSVSFSY